MFIPGRKTDVWYAIDLDTGIKQQTLKLDGTETVCPMMSNKKAPVFLGRTGIYKCTCKGPFTQHKIFGTAWIKKIRVPKK